MCQSALGECLWCNCGYRFDGNALLFCCIGFWCCKSNSLQSINDSCCYCYETAGCGVHVCCLGTICCAPEWLNYYSGRSDSSWLFIFILIVISFNWRERWREWAEFGNLPAYFYSLGLYVILAVIIISNDQAVQRAVQFRVASGEGEELPGEWPWQGHGDRVEASQVQAAWSAEQQVTLPWQRFLTYKHFKFGQVKNLVEKKIKEKLGKEKEGKESYFLYVGGKAPALGISALTQRKRCSLSTNATKNPTASSISHTRSNSHSDPMPS